MKIEKENIKNLIFAGGNVSGFGLTASVLSGWMWVTSIIGSAEAYQLYGIFGSIAYVCGALISFAILIPVVLSVRRSLPETGTYFKLFSGKCPRKVKGMFYLFAVCVSAYVLIEQAVGIADICNRAFGAPFKEIGFFSVAIVTAFIVIFGMKGLLQFEKFAFCAIVFAFVWVVLFGGSQAMSNIFHNKNIGTIIGEAFKSTFAGGIDKVVLWAAMRYFFMAIIIGLSQVILDPAWHIKAKMAKSDKVVKGAFSISGIVLWGSMAFISSIMAGPMLDKGISIAFILIISIIGLGTIGHYMIGMLGIFTVDFYQSYLKATATDREKIVFGRVMTIVFGILCGLVAISLEGISLLAIDMFCAVFFAAACVPFLIIVLRKRSPSNPLGLRPFIAVIVGLAIGFMLWVAGFIPTQWQNLLGTLGAFISSAIVMLLPKKKQNH